MLRAVPTPGSTTARCTVPAGKYPNERASQKPASAGQCTTISCVRSTMRAAGKRLRMQPFITPTNGPWWPKSVVIVITPEGCAALAADIAARRRAPALGAGAAAIGVRHRGEALRLDVLAAHRAAAVAPGVEAAQRRFDLLQLGAGRMRDCPEHVVVLALRHLLGKVRRQRIRLVAQVRARVARALAQLIPAPKQSLPCRIDVHVSSPVAIHAAGLRATAAACRKAR